MPKFVSLYIVFIRKLSKMTDLFQSNSLGVKLVAEKILCSTPTTFKLLRH